jgi:hypothetical protein
MSADLSSVPLGELIWEVAGRLDQLGPPVIYLYERTDPELEKLTVYHGTGRCTATGGSIPPSARRRRWSSCRPARRASCSASAIYTKVESSLMIQLSCGNTFKSPRGARTFWVRAA